MDPQTKSILTSVGMSVAMAATGWAVSKGVIPSGDQPVIANALVATAGAILTALMAWYKARIVSPKAMITAINDAPNGVKVVAESANAPKVSDVRAP